MPVTITLNDELAVRLKAQAQARRISLEQWALTVLDQATAGSQELQTWDALNRKRAELIRRRYTVSLSEAEDCELAASGGGGSDLGAVGSRTEQRGEQ